ncbi:IS701 family transposase [Streptomyces salinarius]|uniref:IS701 family transposase n=1 Tax=Streptomyces salinarius TaxID=2762598 RepID=UPI0013DC41B1|nr:transposase [Streptomyces salinarius]
MSVQAAAFLGAPECAPEGRPRGLTAYGERVFGYLARSDQRRWAFTYLWGLLRTPGRKTVRRMAQTLDLSQTAPQALQQFVTSSPWDWGPAQLELARIALEATPDAVWTAKPVLLRKRGSHSVGLRPGVLPGTGRRVNCQTGIGLFLSGRGHSIPVAWRLLLDHTWCGDPERRRRARIPDELSPRPAWALVLEMLEQFAAAGVAESAPVVLGRDFAQGAHQVAAHLTHRGRDFVVEVPPGQPLVEVAAGAARPSPYAFSVSDAESLVAAHRRGTVSAPPGRAETVSTVVRLLPSGRPAPAAHQAHRLVAEVTSAPKRPSWYWITSLRDAQPVAVRVLARRTAVTEAAVRDVHNELGLLDFEGRSYPGWHHHMTLASAAYLYHRLETGRPVPGSQ